MHDLPLPPAGMPETFFSLAGHGMTLAATAYALPLTDIDVPFTLVGVFLCVSRIHEPASIHPCST